MPFLQPHFFNAVLYKLCLFVCACASVYECACIYWMLFMNVYEPICMHVSLWLSVISPKLQSQLL